LIHFHNHLLQHLANILLLSWDNEYFSVPSPTISALHDRIIILFPQSKSTEFETSPIELSDALATVRLRVCRGGKEKQKVINLVGKKIRKESDLYGEWRNGRDYDFRRT
jgi:hypothetical protein